ARVGLCGEIYVGDKGKEFACRFRLGRACAVGLQPKDLIRGPPRLETVETKTWIRGSSPRKTTSTHFLGVSHKLALQGYFPRTALRERGGGRPNPRLAHTDQEEILTSSPWAHLPAYPAARPCTAFAS